MKLVTSRLLEVIINLVSPSCWCSIFAHVLQHNCFWKSNITRFAEKYDGCCVIYLAYLFANAKQFFDIVGSHALVLFEEEQCTAIVPRERVSAHEADNCDVLWANKKRYKGKLLLVG